MLNVIRTCPSRIKYCGRTVDNLIASNGDDDHRILICSSGRLHANDNGLETIKMGIKHCDGQPFCFLEDDLNFIAGFNRAAEDFTRDCSGARSLILPLCAAYKGLLECKGLAWHYPIKDFYGSQAFVIDPEDAQKFLKFVDSIRPIPSKGFDILLKRWATESGETHFLTPHCAFIQHLGVESSMHNGRFHFYRTWPGPDWRYRSGVFPMEAQKNRPCDLGLVDEIACFFGTELPAYDLGASVGLYVAELRSKGIEARGFDATPGIANEFVEEVDLARPQALNVPSGNVMCLETAEHIHPQNENDFLKNITSLCKSKLVMSWAHPGQCGRGHVNLQTEEYVIQTMKDRGMTMDEERTRCLRVAATKPWFKQNLLAFEKDCKIP